MKTPAMRPLDLHIETLIRKVLSGSANIAESEELTGWVKEHPGHRSEFESFKLLWDNQLAASIDRISLKEEWQKITLGIKAIKSRKKSIAKRNRSILVICIILSILLALLLLLRQGSTETTVLRFDNTTLDQAIKRIQEVYKVKILVETPETLLCQVSGSAFGEENAENVIRAITSNLALQIRRTGPGSYAIVGESCGEKY